MGCSFLFLTQNLFFISHANLTNLTKLAASQEVLAACRLHRVYTSRRKARATANALREIREISA